MGGQEINRWGKNKKRGGGGLPPLLSRCACFKDLRKTSKDLQRDLATKGVNVDSSTVRNRLLVVVRKARSPCKKQLLTVAMEKKRLKWGKKYNKRG